MLFNILEEHYLHKACTFSKAVLPQTISGPYIKCHSNNQSLDACQAGIIDCQKYSSTKVGWPQIW